MEYEDARVFRHLRTPGTGAISRFATDNFVVDSEYAAGTFHNRSPAAYLQDSWRIGTRLTMNAGVRWSAQFLTGASGRIAQRFRAEWQPRVRVQRATGASGTHRAFGSYGRFYQQVPLNLPARVSGTDAQHRGPQPPPRVRCALVGRRAAGSSSTSSTSATRTRQCGWTSIAIGPWAPAPRAIPSTAHPSRTNRQ